jgi:hypothetical protein
MSQITKGVFGQAITRHFEPIAREYGLELMRVSDDTYEIPSSHFVISIRFGVGHGRSISATLKRSCRTPVGESDDKDELGVAVIAGFNGVEMQTRPVNTIEEFFEQTRYVAEMTNTFFGPYIFGQKSDFDKVKKYIEEKIERRANELKQLKFPPSVQKRWHLPKP